MSIPFEACWVVIGPNANGAEVAVVDPKAEEPIKPNVGFVSEGGANEKGLGSVEVLGAKEKGLGSVGVALGCPPMDAGVELGCLKLKVGGFSGSLSLGCRPNEIEEGAGADEKENFGIDCDADVSSVGTGFGPVAAGNPEKLKTGLVSVAVGTALEVGVNEKRGLVSAGFSMEAAAVADGNVNVGKETAGLASAPGALKENAGFETGSVDVDSTGFAGKAKAGGPSGLPNEMDGLGGSVLGTVTCVEVNTLAFSSVLVFVLSSIFTEGMPNVKAVAGFAVSAPMSELGPPKESLVGSIDICAFSTKLNVGLLESPNVNERGLDSVTFSGNAKPELGLAASVGLSITV
jgi:hypothetical protein